MTATVTPAEGADTSRGTGLRAQRKAGRGQDLRTQRSEGTWPWLSWAGGPAAPGAGTARRQAGGRLAQWPFLGGRPSGLEQAGRVQGPRPGRVHTRDKPGSGQLQKGRDLGRQVLPSPVRGEAGRAQDSFLGCGRASGSRQAGKHQRKEEAR